MRKRGFSSGRRGRLGKELEQLQREFQRRQRAGELADWQAAWYEAKIRALQDELRVRAVRS